MKLGLNGLVFAASLSLVTSSNPVALQGTGTRAGVDKLVEFDAPATHEISADLICPLLSALFRCSPIGHRVHA